MCSGFPLSGTVGEPVAEQGINYLKKIFKINLKKS
jgi:hypothetical protein